MRRCNHYDDGIRFYDQGRYAEAITAFEQVVRETPGGELNGRLARFYLGEAHTALALQLAGSHSEAAIAHLRTALEIHPDYADLHFHLGGALLAHDRSDEAIAAFDRALAINPEFARATLLKGAAHYQRGDCEIAFDLMTEALIHDPSLPLPWVLAVRTAHGEGRRDVALAQLKRLTDTGGDEANYLGQLAREHYRAGRFDEAADAYREAVGLAPHYADLRHQYGVTLFALDRADQALAEFVRATEINPRYVEAHLCRGQALRRLGREAEARDAFAAVLALDPDHRAAREALQAQRAA